MTLATYQEEQHITGNGHVEWLELVDGSKGCYFYQTIMMGVLSAAKDSRPCLCWIKPTKDSREARTRADDVTDLAESRLPSMQ